jgi:hypothetical protein
VKRLIDRLRAKDAKLAAPAWVAPWWQEEWKRTAIAVHGMFMHPDLPVLLIDNVAAYYYGSEQERWDLRDHFPNLAPPYPQWWAEFAMPRHIHSGECGDTDVTRLIVNGRVGVLTIALTPEEITVGSFPPNTKWILWSELYIDYGHIIKPEYQNRLIEGVIVGPHGNIFVCVDEHGVIIDRPHIQTYIDTGSPDEEHIRDLITWLHPMYLAVSFLHCHNVRVEDNVIPKPLRKKFRERHGFDPANYKTLVIEPLKQILRHEGQSDKTGLARAMHICRGHFRDYREGRGLFGKYKKLVWMPALVRGTGKKAPPREIDIKI